MKFKRVRRKRENISEKAVIADLSKQAKRTTKRWSWGGRWSDGTKDMRQDPKLFKYAKFGRTKEITKNRSELKQGTKGKYRIYRYSTKHKRKMWASYGKHYKK